MIFELFLGYNNFRMHTRSTTVFLTVIFLLLIGQGISGLFYRSTFLSSQTGQILNCPQKAIGELKMMADVLRIKTVITDDNSISLSGLDPSKLVAVGFPQTYSTLGSRVDKLYSIDTYTRGALLLASAALGGLLLPFATIIFARIWFFLGLMTLAGMGVSCVFCTTSGGFASLDNFLPILVLIAYAIFALPLFLGLTSTKIFRLSTIVSGILCLSPAILIFLIPKACPFCAILLTTNIVLLRFFEHSSTETIEILNIPILNGKLALSVLAIVMLSKVGMVAGVIRSPETKLVDVKKLQNAPLSDIAQNLASDFSGTLIIGMPHCSACEMARDSLKAKSITFREISECSRGQTTPCIRSSQMSGLVSPTIVLTSRGKIVSAFAGWPSTPSSQDDLLRIISNGNPE